MRMSLLLGCLLEAALGCLPGRSSADTMALSLQTEQNRIMRRSDEILQRGDDLRLSAAELPG
jgi:hypothetical protein